jgi:hypothetical protein
MVTLDKLRAGRREEILRLAERRGAHSLRVFGSVARGDANENSDLDLLVAWEPGRSLLDHAGLVQDLQDLLDVKVHIGTEQSLHWCATGSFARPRRFGGRPAIPSPHAGALPRFIRPGREAFMASDELQDAVMRNVEVIGEAAKRVSAEARGRLPSLD